MNSSICLFVLATIFVVVAADAPYPAKLELPLAPYPAAIPAPVYGVPKLELPSPPVHTSYKYELITPVKPVEVLKTGPYPAAILPEPILPIGPYPAPVYGLPKVEIVKPIVPVKTTYSYDLPEQPKLLKTFIAPAPVYGPPKIDLPVFPAPVYGVPRIEILQKPVETNYKYELPLVKYVKPIEVVPVLKSGPYPAPVLIKPHSEYGVPQF